MPTINMCCAVQLQPSHMKANCDSSASKFIGQPSGASIVLRRYFCHTSVLPLYPRSFRMCTSLPSGCDVICSRRCQSPDSS
eukprot:scaffold663104_cov52-Prasinocladus_malaysianus.AAC.1